MKIHLYHTCVKSKTKEPLLKTIKNEKIDKKKWKEEIFSEEGSINLLDYYYGENIKHFNNIENILLKKGIEVKRFIICWAAGIQEKNKKIKPYSLEESNKKEREALFFFLNNHTFDEKALNLFFLKPEDIKTLLPILPKNKIIITSNTKISKEIKGHSLIRYDIEKAKVLVGEGGPVLLSKYPYYLLSKIEKNKINYKELKELSDKLLNSVKKRKKVTEKELEKLIKENIHKFNNKTSLINYLRKEKNISLFIDRFNKIYNKINI